MIKKFKLFESDHPDECPKGIYHLEDRVICKGKGKYGVDYNGEEGTVIAFFHDGSNYEILVRFDRKLKGCGNGDNDEDPTGMSAYVPYSDAELIGPAKPAKIRWYKKGKLEEKIRWFKDGKLEPLPVEKECEHKFDLMNKITIDSKGLKKMRYYIKCSLCGEETKLDPKKLEKA